MSMMDEPADDIFMELMKGMDTVFDGVSDDVLDVTSLSNKALLERNADILEELLDNGQAVNPTSQWARDLHSLRNAIQVEIRKRGV